MIIKSHGIQSRFLQKLNEFYGIQVRQSRFFSGQQNLLVFNCDFSLLLKCLLIFKSLRILMDLFMKWILKDFLVKITHKTFTRQSHSNPSDFFFYFFLTRHNYNRVLFNRFAYFLMPIDVHIVWNFSCYSIEIHSTYFLRNWSKQKVSCYCICSLKRYCVCIL
jgi:hypothetical protein